MLAPANVTGTRPIALVEAVLPAASVGGAQLDSFNRLAQLAVGQNFQARVLSQLDDGGFLVRVGDGAARMNLPAGTQVGDDLDLTLLSTQPRPTFLLGQAAGADTASLSPAARLIDSLLQAGVKDGAPAALVGKTPLLPTPGATAQQVAGALQGTLTFSGLFYESHVAQWAQGGRSLADLMREPPAKRGEAAATAAPPDTKPSEIERLLTTVRHWIDGDAPVAKAPDTPRPDQMNPDATRLINLQLDALEQRRVAWQGELWPGQPLEWEVSEDAPERDADGREQQAWQSVVRFDLPTLGTVSATIRLVGSHVQMQVRTPDQDTAATLRAFQGKLADALDAAGSPLDAFTVRQDDAA